MIRTSPVVLGGSLVLVLVAPLTAPASDLHALEGAWARYRVTDGTAHVPRMDTITLSTPLVEATPDGDALWWQMEAMRGGDRVFAIAMLVSDVAFLEAGGAAPTVHRYILLPAKGEGIEYVDRGTGQARLPHFGLFDGLLPTAAPGPGPALFRLTEFLGRALVPDRASPVGARVLVDPSHLRVLELDDRVLIASSRHFRDDGTGRVVDYNFIPPRLGDYVYVDLDATDYADMIDAGFNLFRLPIDHLHHVLDEPVFFMLYDRTCEVPDLFYRSNYRGGVMYMDEPEVRLGFQSGFNSITEADSAAQALVNYTRNMLEGTTHYGSRYLPTLLADEGWDLGPRFDATEPGIPSWYAFVGTGWYQMEAGATALIQECRVDPIESSTATMERLGVDFPAEPEPWIRFEMAMATGAAQQFDGEWGVSVFGQMEPGAADLLFPLAYQRGARYFWVWTSRGDKGHHVPHDRQLAIVRAFRDWLAAEPGERPRETRPLVAVAAPWGYACDRQNWIGLVPGYLWWRTLIRLDWSNPYGAPHRSVLAAIHRTFLERFQAGDEIDVVFTRPGEMITDARYAAVYYVRPTGLVDTAHPDYGFGPAALAPRLDACPNPFRFATILALEVPAGDLARVQVFDAGGRLVRTLLPARRLEAGRHEIRWDGRDDAGHRVGSGVYFARSVTGEQEQRTKLVRLR